MSSSSHRRYRFPSLSFGAGLSTAQAHLAKIITIIVTIPPLPQPAVSSLKNAARADAADASVSSAAAAVNLDLRLGLATEMPRGSEVLITAGEEDGIPTAHSGVVNFSDRAESGEASTVDKAPKKAESASNDFPVEDKSSEGECSPEAVPIKHGAKESSEVTKEEDDDVVEAERRKDNAGDGYLDLLLEAARQVSTDCWNDKKASPSPPPPGPPQPAASNSAARKRSSSPTPSRSNRRRKTTPSTASSTLNAFHETEPIVRSKRGRNQALPLRYRDSVLEPWRKPPTVFRR